MTPRITIATAKLVERVEAWIGNEEIYTMDVTLKNIIWALASDEELQKDFNIYVNAQRADLALERMRAEA